MGGVSDVVVAAGSRGSSLRGAGGLIQRRTLDCGTGPGKRLSMSPQCSLLALEAGARPPRCVPLRGIMSTECGATHNRVCVTLPVKDGVCCQRPPKNTARRGAASTPPCTGARRSTRTGSAATSAAACATTRELSPLCACCLPYWQGAVARSAETGQESQLLRLLRQRQQVSQPLSGRTTVDLSMIRPVADEGDDGVTRFCSLGWWHAGAAIAAQPSPVVFCDAGVPNKRARHRHCLCAARRKRRCQTSVCVCVCIHSMESARRRVEAPGLIRRPSSATPLDAFSADLRRTAPSQSHPRRRRGRCLRPSRCRDAAPRVGARPGPRRYRADPPPSASCHTSR